MTIPKIPDKDPEKLSDLKKSLDSLTSEAPQGQEETLLRESTSKLDHKTQAALDSLKDADQSIFRHALDSLGK
jgi:hypothetical protein